MLSKWRWIIFSVIILFPIPVIANAIAENDSKTEVSELTDNRISQLLRYTSNQFTQPEKEAESPDADITLEGYERIAENSNLALYVETESLALKIVNKETGYIWSSGLEPDREYNLNDTWRQIAQSALTIEYVDDEANVSSESVLSSETEPELTQIENGFTATIPFEQSGISIQLEVILDSTSVEVSIPQAEIMEQTNKLASVQVYPFLGAVEGTDRDGYLFIPDGSGALMRFENKQFSSVIPYQAHVYGEDEGFRRDTNTSTDEEQQEVIPEQQVTMPVYGVTHGVDENSFVTIIDEGKSFAEILAYPSGASTDFHWVTTQYNYRYRFFQPTSQSMSGYNTYQEEMNQFDVKERITFLSDEDANYVGMAKTFQRYLVDNDMLTKHEDQVDVWLEFLGSEVKSGLLWDSVHTMTEITDIPEYINQLKEQNVDNMHVAYRGWTQGGLTGTLPQKFPLENNLGSKQEFEEVHDYLDSNEISMYYYTDYTKAYEGATGFSGRTDVARKINSETITKEDEGKQYYYLSPTKSLEIAEEDQRTYQENGIDNLAVDTSSSVLFSDFNQDIGRRETIAIYQEMFTNLHSSLDTLALYQPNDYMLPLTDRYLDVPMYSSNFSFVSDTVPFLQVVLKGYIPYYAPFSNFHYNPEDEMLRMIEYGAYPSFYLTSAPSHELMYSPSRDLYTSQFDDWEGEIVEQYAAVKESLGEVEGETIEFREVHDVGIVEVGYSNGKSIIVNYTNDDVTLNYTVIEAKGFQVTDGGNSQ